MPDNQLESVSLGDMPRLLYAEVKGNRLKSTSGISGPNLQKIYAVGFRG